MRHIRNQPFAVRLGVILGVVVLVVAALAAVALFALHRVDDRLQQAGAIAAKDPGEASRLADGASGLVNVSTLLVIGLFVVVAVIALVAGRLLAAHLIHPLRLLTERMVSLSEHCMADLRRALDGLAAGELTHKAVTVTEPIEVDSGTRSGSPPRPSTRCWRRSSRASSPTARRATSCRG